MMIYNLFSTYLIMINLLLFNISSLFFSDLLMIWFIMEISNLLFIYLMSTIMNQKKLIFLYFIIQIMASFTIIYTIILNFLMINYNFMNPLMTLAIFLKMSIPPFHLWLPLICRSMPWNIIAFLLTIQKIPPFYILSLMKMNSLCLYITLLLTSLIPPYMLMINTNIKILLAYSSINQSGWMIIMIYFKNMLWLKYFIFYTFITFIFLNMFHYYNIFMNMNIFSNSKWNIFILLYMFNMASLPPFSFFFLKWYSLFLIMYNSNLFFILMLMMISSLIMLYIYVSMMIYSMFMNKFMFKFFKFIDLPQSFLNYFKLYSNIFTLLMSLIILIL
uniref:NADH dehydrogenase subunit 2 n=1 Tax=Stenamma expolitum TaxID=625355 RepID=UPI001FCD329A|nr:NADH dehydrogenase subunit 2 [Stenamma expolitum]UNZ99540.1 NADH dehydrogenase subunit 2 [Stenamma expolitum]